MTIETFPFDAADYLDSEEAIVILAEEALAEESSASDADTVRTIVRALGLTALADFTGMPRRSLVDAMSGQDSNKAEMFRAVLRAAASRQLPQAAE